MLAVGFTEFVEEATWLSPIVVVPKKNGKLKICIDFKKLNVTTKKDPYPLLFIDEMLNTLVRYESYSFLDGYSGYHQISIALKDKYKTAFVINWGGFYMGGDAIWSKQRTSNISKSYDQNIKKVFG